MPKKKKKSPGRTTKPGHVFLARIRRDFLGGISLDLIRDEDPVELVEGDEFATVVLTFDPFAPKG